MLNSKPSSELAQLPSALPISVKGEHFTTAVFDVIRSLVENVLTVHLQEMLVMTVHVVFK